MMIGTLHISLFTERLSNSFEIISKCWDCSQYIQTAPLTHIKNHSASSCQATCATQLSGALPSSEVAPHSVLKKEEVRCQTQVLWRRHEKADTVDLLKNVRVWPFELFASCSCLWMCFQQRSCLDAWEWTNIYL